jgi:predicted alpha-1,6-mannanase (GH76 family)
VSQEPQVAGTPAGAERARPDYRGAAGTAIGVLQRWYSRWTGLWKTTGWWNSANALTAVIRYGLYTGDQTYRGVVENTFVRAQWRKAGFINDFFDDNLWWALAWVAAFDLTGDHRYLRAAQAIFAHSLSGWDDTCHGGLWWNQDRKYKNAITNELFLTLAGLLSQRVPANREYRDWALREWEWLRASGLIGPVGLVNDGLTPACANNGGTTWTYNQGVILGGLAVLHEITGDGDFLRQGEVIADATLRSLVNARGVLAEPCEESGCDGDQTQFKGIFVRYLQQFSARSGKPAYRAFILENAGSVMRNAGNPAGEFGLRWDGPFDKADASRQTSAVEALIAAAALTGQELGPALSLGLEHRPQFGARGHAELGEELVQMGADCPVRDVQPFSDLAVRQPVGRQLCDLEPAIGQLGPCAVRRPASRLDWLPRRP